MHTDLLLLLLLLLQLRLFAAALYYLSWSCSLDPTAQHICGDGTNLQAAGSTQTLGGRFVTVDAFSGALHTR